MSFYVCLLAKIIAYVTLNLKIGSHKVNDQDTKVYMCVIFSLFLIDFYLYLIFSVAICSMVRIKAIITY